jgi:hypothetical protein
MGCVCFTSVRVEEVDSYDVTHADRCRHGHGRNEETTCDVVTGRNGNHHLHRGNILFSSTRTEVLELTFQPQIGKMQAFFFYTLYEDTTTPCW